jgi:hypothetical protein
MTKPNTLRLKTHSNASKATTTRFQPILEHLEDRLVPAANYGGVANILSHSEECFQNQVKPLYSVFLGRDGGQAEIAGWAGQLARGALTTQQIEAYFASSNEFIRRVGGSDSAWIAALYRIFLERTANSAEKNAWASALSSGATHFYVSYQFSGSSEFLAKQIESQYQLVLRRKPSSQEKTYWVQRVQSGLTLQDFQTNVFSSDECIKLYSQYKPYAGTAQPSNWLAHAFFQLIGRKADDRGFQSLLGMLVGNSQTGVPTTGAYSFSIQGSVGTQQFGMLPFSLSGGVLFLFPTIVDQSTPNGVNPLDMIMMLGDLNINSTRGNISYATNMGLYAFESSLYGTSAIDMTSVSVDPAHATVTIDVDFLRSGIGFGIQGFDYTSDASVYTNHTAISGEIVLTFTKGGQDISGSVHLVGRNPAGSVQNYEAKFSGTLQ